ncbi:GH17780 [Drosophila grimshawi]|uniref:GH17780 n=1 Tax=Drosophila grimshawi TaxID=7222 RepID=B4JXQ1_DROGR|nr:GH17780 [Drosophila grimshawi]
MYRIGPIGRKSNFHSREKCLIGLVLITLCFLCFGGIFLLPDNFGSERVLRVYKHFQKAGPEIFIPAPPLAAHASRNEDPHFMGDRQRLQQKIIAELGDILDEEPQVAPAAAAGDADAQAPAPAAQQEQPVEQDVGAEQQNRDSVPLADHTTHNNNNNNGQPLKLPMGVDKERATGEHADAAVEEKRLKVKEPHMLQAADALMDGNIDSISVPAAGAAPTTTSTSTTATTTTTTTIEPATITTVAAATAANTSDSLTSGSAAIVFDITDHNPAGIQFERRAHVKQVNLHAPSEKKTKNPPKKNNNTKYCAHLTHTNATLNSISFFFCHPLSFKYKAVSGIS